MSEKKDHSLAELLAEFNETEGRLKAKLVYKLSDLAEEDQPTLSSLWPTLKLERRRTLMSRLAEASETNFELDFTEVARLALEDADAQVRQSALDALWHNVEAPVMRKLIDLARNDPDEAVQAAAAASLGRFVLAAELDEFPKSRADEAVAVLTEICRSNPVESLRFQRALESLSYLSSEEISGWIEQVARHPSTRLQACALFAMGRSGDERWGKPVLKALDSPEPELRFEAARAAGELLLAQALPQLSRLALEPDIEIQASAIWALGEIGGPEALETLYQVGEQFADEEIQELVDEAVQMALLGSADGIFQVMLDIPDDEENDVLLEEDPEDQADQEL